MSIGNAENKTFLDVYNLNIAPKLRELDIFLKEREVPATVWQISQLLDMPYDDVKTLLHNMKIEQLKRETIFILIMTGTSPICRLIQKETERGFPVFYTPDDISAIYEINIAKIKTVFKTLGVHRVKESWLPFVFNMLPADDGRYSK